MDVKYLPQMQDESECSYVFVAIDRATRWVFIAIKRHKTAAAATSFLNALHKAAPFRIKTLLADNGREFTDRAFGKRERDASGQHEFDGPCAALGIEHRLTKPRHSQTNGMVERFNGRLNQVLKSHRFNRAHDPQTTLHRFACLYNELLPQRALDLAASVQALKKWQASHPDLFSKRVMNHPGPTNN
jgi:transposase InsO family protein